MIEAALYATVAVLGGGVFIAMVHWWSQYAVEATYNMPVWCGLLICVSPFLLLAWVGLFLAFSGV